jgi:dipeptidyl aminopeptidase/acylaminoacyl peptidase
MARSGDTERFMAKRRPITIDDLWRIERVGQLSAAPDGGRVVASVTGFSMDDNKATSNVWLLSTAGGEPRKLTWCGENDGQPQWSPRGDRIAFVAKREQQGHKDDEPQLYVIPADGGEARRIGPVATGVDAFRWCSDGRRIAFVSWVWPELAGHRAQARRHTEFKARKETGYVTSEAQYRFWDRNLPMGRVPHLHVIDADARSQRPRDLLEGTPYELTRSSPSADSFDVSPDGRRIVFAFDPSPEKRTDNRFALAEIDIRTGRIEIVVHDGEWNCDAPRYSPDGGRIAFIAQHDGRKHTMPGQLAIWTRDTRTWEVVSADWDRAVAAPLVW